MSDKPRFPLPLAREIAQTIVRNLEPQCERICIAGSIRRAKPMVGDIEIIYQPRWILDLFGAPIASEADEAIADLVKSGLIAPRQTRMGSDVWGGKNKLALHVETGIPVDLFQADQENWWNYLVCRTGPAESNVKIAKAAKRIGWQWKPYSPGFLSLDGSRFYKVRSEQDVFAFVGLPYFEPEDRQKPF